MITKYRYTSPQATAKQQESVPLPPHTAPRAQSNFTFRRICCLCEPFWHNKKFSRSRSPSRLLTLSFSLCFVYFFFVFWQNKQHKYGFLIKMPKLCQNWGCKQVEIAGLFRLAEGAGAVGSLSRSPSLSLLSLSMSMSRHCMATLLLFLWRVSLCGSSSRSVLGGKVTCCHWRNFIACLPVLSVCLLVPLSLCPLSYHFIALSHSLPLSCFALNTLARQCDAFVMKRISGIRCLCVGNLGVSTQLCTTWLAGSLWKRCLRVVGLGML